MLRVFHEGEGKARKSSKSEELSFSVNGNGKTMIETSKKFEAELSTIKEELNKLSEGRNLLEPFERLKLACEQVSQQKSVE